MILPDGASSSSVVDGDGAVGVTLGGLVEADHARVSCSSGDRAQAGAELGCLGGHDAAVGVHGVRVDAVRRAQHAQRAGDATGVAHRRDDGRHVGLEQVTPGDVPLGGDLTPEHLSDRQPVQRHRAPDPAAVPDGVGALDLGDVDRRLVDALDREVRRLAGRRTDAVERGAREPGELVAAERGRAELDHPGAGAEAAAVVVAADEAAALEGAQQPQRRAGRQPGVAGALGEGDGLAGADLGEQGQRALDGAGRAARPGAIPSAAPRAAMGSRLPEATCDVIDAPSRAVGIRIDDRVRVVSLCRSCISAG